jgi:hypothetical protein
LSLFFHRFGERLTSTSRHRLKNYVSFWVTAPPIPQIAVASMRGHALSGLAGLHV